MADILATMFLGFCDTVFINGQGDFHTTPTIELDPKITTQDDPFDRWVVRCIESMNLEDLKVYTAGPLTHPDTVFRYRADDGSNDYVGLEIKKLNASAKGKDPRGMTIDYNSTIPCGTFRVYDGNGDHLDVKGFYLFALLDHRIDAEERQIFSFILADGDLLNDDLELYLQSKTANISEYGHGPYGEGSIRRRAMYLYPNPLDSKIAELAKQVSLIHASDDLEDQYPDLVMTHSVKREKKDGDIKYFYIYKHAKTVEKPAEVPEIELFAACAKRKAKPRAAYKFVVAD